MVRRSAWSWPGGMAGWFPSPLFKTGRSKPAPRQRNASPIAGLKVNRRVGLELRILVSWKFNGAFIIWIDGLIGSFNVRYTDTNTAAPGFVSDFGFKVLARLRIVRAAAVPHPPPAWFAGAWV